MANEFPELKKAVNELGDAFVMELINQLLIADKAASGRLIKSLDYEVVELLDNLMIRLHSEPYLINVDQGRKPGSKPPPSSAILPWIKLRGIKGRDSKGKFITDKSLAFVIARSIGIKGIRPTNVIQKAKNNIMKKKTEILAKAATKDVMNALNKILTNL
jgi:hypothetical protein